MAPEPPARPAALEAAKPSDTALTKASLDWRLSARQVEKKPFRLAPMVNLPKPLLARVIMVEQQSQCVPYARQRSDIQIHGDAWTWWDKARGRYDRTSMPQHGSVLVLKKKQQAGSLGHVAFVEDVIDSRTIVVSHANWLNRGQVHRYTPVRDISTANDWTEVRFWHTPGGHYGGQIYQPYGFILPNRQTASR